MWFEEVDGFAELFRGYFPYYLIIALPIFIIISPANPVAASHEFPVYRMQQFDLQGIPHGCRSAPINIEARSLTTWSTSRHCVITQLQELTIETFRDVAERAGALLIILPSDLASLTTEQKQHTLELEDLMLGQEVPIPVYFTMWTPELQNMIEDISSRQKSEEKQESALHSIMNSVSANGYQIVVNINQAVARTDVTVANIQGKLSGYGVEDKLPTVAIVAYYDSFGIAPELALGADSNGSGVSVLLELARLFSQLYSSVRTHGHVNLLFLLSGAGKLNYHGSKKWLEDQLDSLEGSLLQEAAFVLCLDSLAATEDLYLHVSKPPKDGSPGARFYQELREVSRELFPEMRVESVHKKINLADEMLAWEHERHSIRRLPAFTLSSHKSHQDLARGTILDLKVNSQRLSQKAQVIAEALSRYIYNMSSAEIFSESLNVDTSSLESHVSFLTSQPRAAQILSSKQNPIVNSLQSMMSRYLKEVKVTNLVPDKRDPEFVLFDVTKATVNVYSVKPAVFDLFLTILIVAYLVVVYFLIQHFPKLYEVVSKFVNTSKSKNY